MEEQKRITLALAVLGLLMPVLCMVFNLAFGGQYNEPQFLTSISASHYSSAYLLFEGLLFSMGVLFFLLRGKTRLDTALYIIAGACSLLLALFPCFREAEDYRNFVMASPEVAHQVHFVMSILLFACYVLIIGFRFTRKEGAPARQKKARNKLSIICAILIAASVVIGYVGKNMLNIEIALYVGEVIAFWSFGLAFLAKGGVILKDK